MNIGLIGIRSGSKTIKDKNIKSFCGKPLVYWILKAAQNSILDKIYVLTDSKKYMDIVKSFNFNKVYISKEKTIIKDGNVNLPCQFMNDFPEIEFDNIALMQACYPLLKSKDIDNALIKFIEGKYESLITVTTRKKFIWGKTDTDYIYPKNYDPLKRPRKQEWDGEIFEIGACYICSKDTLKKYNNFIGTLNGYYELPFYMFNGTDEVFDWEILEVIAEKVGLYE